MAKGEDAVRRKKNKAIRRKLRKQNDSSSVSAKVASIIAAKKRRLAGKRRMCQGMCFSLPTPDDPFNDRHGKEEVKTKGTKTKKPSQKDERSVDGKTAARKKGTIIDPERSNIEVIKKGSFCGPQEQCCENSETPSKFLIWCLHSIENALRHDDAHTDGEENSLFSNSWGLEFWKCYSTGKNMMEISGNFATTEQIAWIVSSAADTIARKEKEGLSFASPFLLFLVPSQEKAAKVRTVCKALKPLGIHTVSIHPGASLDHQIQGLKSCEPEFLVATPERFLELVSLKAIDISGASMLVVDGLDSICSSGHIDTIKSIRESISGAPRLVLFNDCTRQSSMPVLQCLLEGSICKLSINGSVTSQSSCIVQSVEVCASEEEKLKKSIQVLDQSWSGQTHKLNVLYILRKGVKSQKLVATLKSKGCSISVGSGAQILNNSEDTNSSKKPAVSMIDLEEITTADIGKYNIVVLPCFVPSIDSYVRVLTKMGRDSVNGVLYSLLTKEDTKLAGPLIEILEQWRQTVPEALQNLHLTSNMMEE